MNVLKIIVEAPGFDEDILRNLKNPYYIVKFRFQPDLTDNFVWNLFEVR